MLFFISSRGRAGHLIFFLSLLLVTGPLGSATATTEEPPVLSLLERKWLYINEEVSFQPGQLLEVQPGQAGELPGSAWRATELPVQVSRADGTIPRAVSFVYTIPPAVARAWAKRKTGLTLITSQISDVSAIYFNGHLLSQHGERKPYHPGLYRYHQVDIPWSLIRTVGPNQIGIQIFSPRGYPVHIYQTPDFVLGPSSRVVVRLHNSQVFKLIMIAAYFLIGLYHLFLVVGRPQDKYNLFFGLFCLFVSFYWVFTTIYRDILFGADPLWRARVEHASLYCIGPFLLFFFSRLLRHEYPRKFIAYSVFSGLLVVNALISPYDWMRFALRVWQLSVILVLIYIVFYILRSALVDKNRDARYLSAGVVLFIFGIFYDLLVALGFIPTANIASYTFSGFVLGIAVVLSSRFMRVHNEVEELNANLEEKVKKRTEQLSDSLNEIRELKQHQDGDYFLTSLLLNPLAVNQVDSPDIRVDFFSRQKKNFVFRKWKREIGGDINIAHSIELQGRRYVAVVNGDAMGKSLQGAGGALVLGALFRAIIERTHLSSREQSQHPEGWLKNLFIELHRVFISFDGSMLMSLVIALVDNATGLMYYLNAEHPWTVLYRDGKALFIERETRYRKLGTPGLEQKQVEIALFQLEKGDVIIAGSDGRDDLELGTDEEGLVIVQSDEERFLEHVENGRGDLKRIFELISNTGKIMDDTSLVRIEYTGDFQAHPEPPAVVRAKWLEARAAREGGNIQLARRHMRTIFEVEPLFLDNARALVEILIREKDFEAALAVVREVLDRRPSTSSFLLQGSWILFKLGRAREAADLGERLRLRNRKNCRVILLLLEIHKEQENYARMGDIFQDALAEIFDQGPRNAGTLVDNPARHPASPGIPGLTMEQLAETVEDEARPFAEKFIEWNEWFCDHFPD